MKINSLFVTGANRGIGLEFVRQFSQLSDPPSLIFATYRTADTLQDLKILQDSSVKARIILIKLDVTRPDEIEEAKEIVETNVGDKGLNLLINNAGIAKSMPFSSITPENLYLHFQVNTVGPVMILQAFFPLLEKAAALNPGDKLCASRAGVLNLTSMLGSIYNTGITTTEDLILPGYKISKAALNMVMRAIAATVKDKGILVVNMCPGWVKTDMGGHDRGQITVTESISNMIQTLPKLDESHHGSYMDRMGKQYPF